jgi:hypothetical protein
MELKSLGKKQGGMEAMPTTKENEMYYPSVTLTQDMLPQLKGKDVDDKITLTVEVKVCGISKYGNGNIEYRLDLIKAGIDDNEESED